jgi:hypothetical protein
MFSTRKIGWLPSKRTFDSGPEGVSSVPVLVMDVRRERENRHSKAV